MSDQPQVGEKRWVWHFDILKEVLVNGVYEIQGRPHIEYGGFATDNFYKTRLAAVEARVVLLCAEIKTVQENHPEYNMGILTDIAASTLAALKE